MPLGAKPQVAIASTPNEPHARFVGGSLWRWNCDHRRVANTTPSPQRARTLALQNRSFEFTCAIITAYPHRSWLDDPSREMWRQLVRAAASTTFNMEEADAASSDADFLAKMRISLREIKEARVVMRVIVRWKLANHEMVVQYLDEASQLVAIFMTIVKNKEASVRTRTLSS
jgi:four helix bundle protein